MGILLIGSKGILGQQIIQSKIFNNRIMYINSTKNESLSEFEFIDIDTISSQLLKKLNKIEIVIYMKSFTRPNSLIESSLDNLNNDIKYLDYIYKNILRKNMKFIYFSSGGAIYGDQGLHSYSEVSNLYPKNSYGLSKLYCENYIRLLSKFYKIKTKIIRISNPYGVTNKNYKLGLIDTIALSLQFKDVVNLWGDIDNIRDYIHISDVMNALKIITDDDSDYDIVNIGSGVGYSIRDVLNIFISNQHIIKFNTTAINKMDISHNVLDITKLKNKYDYTPSVSLYDWVSKIGR